MSGYHDDTRGCINNRKIKQCWGNISFIGFLKSYDFEPNQLTVQSQIYVFMTPEIR